MNKFFLYGDCNLNAGPSNVNRAFVESSEGDLCYLKQRYKILKAIEFFYKSLTSNVIIVSGYPLLGIRFSFIKVLKRKVVYIMHGNLEYENRINNLNLAKDILEGEKHNLEYADRIVCVSEGYSKWIGEKYPEFKNKITYVNNGLKISPRKKKEKVQGTIAVSGGNRFIKNNLTVSKAVEQLNKEGIQCSIYVFGRIYPQNEDLKDDSYIHIVGHLDKENYYNKLDAVSLFIVDSLVESFGLVIGDALNCRCSLLLSKNVGAKSIICTNEHDIINNATDVEEVKEKIKYLLQNPNSDRLLSSVDVEKCSYKQAYFNLKEKCQELLKENEKK